MAEYTPTTAEIREYVEVGGEPRPWEEITPETESKEAARAAAFDRWLAAHDAQVLRDAAEDWEALVRQEKPPVRGSIRSEEHTSELQSLMRISYAVFCLKKNTQRNTQNDRRSKMTTDTT